MKIEKLSDKMVYMDGNVTKRTVFNEEKVLNFVLNLKPGQGVPPHNHEHSELIVHILVGEGEMVVDEKPHKVAQGDIIHCKGTEMFSLSNTGSENMSCFVILAPSPSAMYAKEF